MCDCEDFRSCTQPTIFSLSLLLASLDPVSASSLQRLASHFCSLSSACGGATGRLAVLAHRKTDSTVPRTSILQRPLVCGAAATKGPAASHFTRTGAS